MYKGTLVVAGECMCTRPFSMRQEPEFLDLIRILRQADTTYCHLEINIHDKKSSYPGRPFAVSALQADPIIAQELKWAGIDLVSCAYNHGLDCGLPGLLGTIDSLDKAGLVHAGTGNNLEEAREPAYFESRAGRVAIVSMSSGHHPYDSAGPVKAPFIGRAGVNPLRIRQKYVVIPERLEQLKEIWAALGLSMKKPHFVKEEVGDVFLNAGDRGGGNETTFVFRAGDKPDVITLVDPWDLEGNLRAIRDARRQADLVLVAHHAAVNDGARGDRPCKFVIPFAKQCIDAGADIYIGHGWHRELGIEIYKDKPIWYGTGNFFAQSQFMQRIPADTYEGHGFGLADLATLTPADLHDTREKHMSHWKETPGGVIVVLNMEDGKFTEMQLHPISLGYDFGDAKTGKIRETGSRMEGRPLLADKENAEKIIAHVKRLSEVYGTHIEYKDGIGLVKIQ
jgi:poly-gamma-glutamate capsule biosynthesis protein CapA/YwtB (metallophosphatase superfamily)